MTVRAHAPAWVRRMDARRVLRVIQVALRSGHGGEQRVEKDLYHPPLLTSPAAGRLGGGQSKVLADEYRRLTWLSYHCILFPIKNLSYISSDFMV